VNWRFAMRRFSGNQAYLGITTLDSSRIFGGKAVVKLHYDLYLGLGAVQ